jgi:hypothetical protein
MNGWITTTTNLIPTLGLLPLGAAVVASFTQRDPARVKVRSTREDGRKERGRS